MVGRLSKNCWRLCSDIRQRLRVAAYCGLGVVAFTGTLRAQSAEQAAPPQAPTTAQPTEALPQQQFVAPEGTSLRPPAKPIRYGYQTLVFDVAALGLLFGTRSFWAGGAVFVSGAPVIHFVHGNLGSGLASLGTRAAAIYAVHLAFSCDEDAPSERDLTLNDRTGDCNDDYALGVLAVLSLPVIATFDAAVLAKKRPPETTAATWSLTPVVSQGRGGVSLAGRF